PSLNPLGQQQHNRAHEHRHRQRSDPLQHLAWLLRRQQHHRRNRRGSGKRRNRKWHDQRLTGRVATQRPFRVRKDHPKRDQEQHDPTCDAQRQVRQLHHPQEPIASDHEREQDPERDRHLAQNHLPAPLARNRAQYVNEDRNIAQRIRDQDQQDCRGQKCVLHSKLPSARQRGANPPGDESRRLLERQ
ncbi:hypothetical protein DFQ30_005459, partial [Apophysomyces sp. BC1015]